MSRLARARRGAGRWLRHPRAVTRRGVCRGAARPRHAGARQPAERSRHGTAGHDPHAPEAVSLAASNTQKSSQAEAQHSGALSHTQLSTSEAAQPAVTLGAQQSPLHSPQPSPLTSVTQTLSQPSLQQRGSASQTQAVMLSSAQRPPTCGEQHAPSGSAGGQGSSGSGRMPASRGGLAGAAGSVAGVAVGTSPGLGGAGVSPDGGAAGVVDSEACGAGASPLPCSALEGLSCRLQASEPSSKLVHIVRSMVIIRKLSAKERPRRSTRRGLTGVIEGEPALTGAGSRVRSPRS